MTSREWRQCRAALRFWYEVAEHSDRHPADHPAIHKQFYAGTARPLSQDEILSLVDRDQATAEALTEPLAAVSDVAREQGLCPVALRRQAVRMKLPILYHGKIHIYRHQDLTAAARRLKERDAAYKRRYSHVPPMPKT